MELRLRSLESSRCDLLKTWEEDNRKVNKNRGEKYSFSNLCILLCHLLSTTPTHTQLWCKDAKETREERRGKETAGKISRGKERICRTAFQIERNRTTDQYILFCGLFYTPAQTLLWCTDPKKNKKRKKKLYTV